MAENKLKEFKQTTLPSVEQSVISPQDTSVLVSRKMEKAHKTQRIGGATINKDTSLIDTGADIIEERANRLDNRLVFVGNFNDGLTESPGATGSITRRLLETGMSSGNATTCLLYSALFAGQIGKWAVDYDFSISIATTSTTTQDILVGLYDSTGAVPADATLSDNHIGFFVQDGTLYASSGDSSTGQTTLQIKNITLTDWNNYRFEYENGVGVNYFVNDELVANITTNLPTAASNGPRLYLGIESQTGGPARVMQIKNNYQVIARL